MARDVESLVLQMSADLRRFDRSMAAMRATADKRLNEVEKRALQADRKLSKAMGDAGRNMTTALRSSLSGISGALAAAFSVDAIVGLADSYTQMQNRLKTTGLDANGLREQFEALNAVADASRSPIEAVVATYSRLRLASEGMGFTNEQVTRTTEILSKALKASGATAGEATAALLQFGQAIGSGTLQGDELRSIRENAPAVARAIADEFGVTVGGLKKLGEEGKLTSERVMKAVLNSGAAIDAVFARTEATVGDALTNLQNKITNYIGLTDDSTSATDRMRQAINALADNLDTVALVIGAVATIMGGRFVLAMTAGSGAMIANGIATARLAAFQTAMTASMTGSTTATVIATGAMARFNAMLAANPIGLAILAVAALAAGLVYLNSKYGEAAVATRELAAATEASDRALSEYEKAQIAARDASGASARAARENAAAMREEAQAAIVAARALAAKRTAEAQARLETATAAFDEVRRARPMEAGEAIGQTAFAAGAQREAQAAQVRAAAAIREQIRQEQEFQRISAGINLGGATTTRTPTAEDDKKSRKASGPTPEELARQRQLLDLQAEIALLRAQDRDAEADARQDALDVLNLTKQYEEAGFANAQAKAEAQVAALATAREAARLAEESARQAEGEARALDMMRGFALEMLGVQEDLALTDRDALAVRRQILAIRQAERRAALETAAVDTEATDAERASARAALAGLGGLESGENRALEGSSGGARMAQDIVANLNPYANAVEQAAEAYAEIDRMRREDGLAEADAARAKAQIDNDLREQRLVGTRTMLDTLASLQNSSNKKLAALGKAAAIAQATIDGVLAVQKALASAPPPFNFIQAAIVGAVAAANVASIAGMADGGLVEGAGGPRQDNQLRRLSVGEFVNNAASVRKNRPFLEAANNGADLSKMIPGLAGGGVVGRVNAATAVAAAARPSAASVTFSPIVNAPGADMGVARQIRDDLDSMARNLPGIINGVVAQRQKYRTGTRR